MTNQQPRGASGKEQLLMLGFMIFAITAAFIIAPRLANRSVANGATAASTAR